MSNARGLEHRYNITRADGTPVSGRYFVLKLDSNDLEHAYACRQAVRAYADTITKSRIKHLVPLATDIKNALKEWFLGDNWAMWDKLIGRRP